MSESNQMTFREAVLSSLLLHAATIILLLLFPDAFTRVPGRAQRVAPDPNTPLPVEFLEPPREPEETVMADAGNLLSSDPRPPDAPAPENEDPYAVGNNPNRFLAPPVTAPPEPEVGDATGAALDPIAPPAGEEASGETVEENPTEGSDSDPGNDDMLDPTAPRGAPVRRGDAAAGAAEPGSTPKGSIREALGQIAGSMQGGAPLRFDNPVGGFAGPGGGLSFDTKGFNWGPYARKIYWIIWRNWTQGWPPAARAGLPGIVSVRFRIHRDGTISGIQVLDPSGTEAFDTCATLALEASSPLPPLPPEFEKESEGITARFLYNVDR